MKIKTSDLTGAALDWAVAKCEGEEVRLYKGQLETRWTDSGWKPSTNWSQGGPILERNDIELDKLGNGDWRGSVFKDGHWVCEGTGPTTLIAAMRCYVASKLGEEVEVPDELA